MFINAKSHQKYPYDYLNYNRCEISYFSIQFANHVTFNRSIIPACQVLDWTNLWFLFTNEIITMSLQNYASDSLNKILSRLSFIVLIGFKKLTYNFKCKRVKTTSHSYPRIDSIKAYLKTIHRPSDTRRGISIFNSKLNWKMERKSISLHNLPMNHYVWPLSFVKSTILTQIWSIYSLKVSKHQWSVLKPVIRKTNKNHWPLTMAVKAKKLATDSKFVRVVNIKLVLQARIITVKKVA